MISHNFPRMKFVLVFIPCFISQCLQNSLTDELVIYDNRIIEILRTPTLRNRHRLIEDIDWYNKHLVDVLQNVKNDDYNTYMNVNSDLNKFVHHMWKTGGPDFLKLTLNNTELQQKLNFSNDKMQEMYYSFGATQVLWDELRELDPKAVHYFSSFNKSDYDELLDLDKQGKLNDLIDFTKLGNISGDVFP